MLIPVKYWLNNFFFVEKFLKKVYDVCMEIIINDVTLRDGLQNEPYIVSTEDKVKLINLIIDSGIKHLEITSFVNPKLIPQLSDSISLSKHKMLKDAYFSALVPNLRGFKNCVETKIKEAVLFVSVCEEHNLKNLGRNIDSSLKNLKNIFNEAGNYKINLRAAISMVFGTPFLNDLPDDKKLFKVIDFFIENRVTDITLSDTWGNADSKLFEKQLKKILKKYDFKNFSLHLHNIGGNGIINAETALDFGIKKFDTSFGGLGGCPFSPEKGGNLNIRDFISLVDKKGYLLKINREKLLNVESFLMKLKMVNRNS